MAAVNNYIRAGAFHGFSQLTAEWGVAPEEILQRVGLDSQQLSDPDNLVSGTAFVRALQFAAERTQRMDFGLRLGSRQDINMLGATGLLARQCATAGEALQAVGRYVKLHNPSAIVEVQRTGQQALLCYDDMTPQIPRNPQICNLAMAVGVGLIRHFMGAGWAPKAAYFIHPAPADTRFYRELFAAPLYFNHDLYAVEFDAGVLDRRSAQTDPQLRAFFYRHVTQLEGQYGQDTTSMVRYLIRSLLGSGHCSEERVAAILQINRRTLQRRLRAENVSFRELLADARAELAEQYISNTGISLTDLAGALDFSELSAFSRFFKTRFGVSPSRFRQ